mmetsp:Transcript_12293/g.30269  ORF Transcript_12293/g.30269 Transcript_12293/m.30269 type:complete len:218 (+) Transcript_12293:366-1019(+)
MQNMPFDKLHKIVNINTKENKSSRGLVIESKSKVPIRSSKRTIKHDIFAKSMQKIDNMLPSSLGATRRGRVSKYESASMETWKITQANSSPKTKQQRASTSNIRPKPTFYQSRQTEAKSVNDINGESYSWETKWEPATRGRGKGVASRQDGDARSFTPPPQSKSMNSKSYSKSKKRSSERMGAKSRRSRSSDPYRRKKEFNAKMDVPFKMHQLYFTS